MFLDIQSSGFEKIGSDETHSVWFKNLYEDTEVRVWDFPSLNGMHTISIDLVKGMDTDDEYRMTLVSRFGVKNIEELDFVLSRLSRLNFMES